MSKKEEILEFALAEMRANKIEDTTNNRLLFLQGLRDGWKEDETTSLEKTLYQMALASMISQLEVKRMLNK